MNFFQMFFCGICFYFEFLLCDFLLAKYWAKRKNKKDKIK